MVAQGVSNQAGEFHIVVPEAGTYSISAVVDTYRSEYVVVKIGGLPPPPVSAPERIEPRVRAYLGF